MTERGTGARRPAAAIAPVLRPVVGIACTLATFGAGTAVAQDARADARRDPVLRAAISIDGEYAAALAISQSCPRAFTATQSRFVREQTAASILAVQAYGRRRGLDAQETAARPMGPGDHNIAAVRAAVSKHGCGAARVRRTVEEVKTRFQAGPAAATEGTN